MMADVYAHLPDFSGDSVPFSEIVSHTKLDETSVAGCILLMETAGLLSAKRC